MHSYDFIGNRKSDSASAAGCVAFKEFCFYFFKLVRRNSDSGILYGNIDKTVFRADCGNCYGTALVAVFKGVVDYVYKNLAKPVFVAGNGNYIVVFSIVKRFLFTNRPLLKGQNRFGKFRDYVEFHWLENHSSAL